MRVIDIKMGVVIPTIIQPIYPPPVVVIHPVAVVPNPWAIAVAPRREG